MATLWEREKIVVRDLWNTLQIDGKVPFLDLDNDDQIFIFNIFVDIH